MIFSRLCVNSLTYKHKKKGVCMTPLVIQAGFEPTTHSLEGCCSIQLSYWTSPFALHFH